jgi:hypothetical protein
MRRSDTLKERRGRKKNDKRKTGMGRKKRAGKSRKERCRWEEGRTS